MANFGVGVRPPSLGPKGTVDAVLGQADGPAPLVAETAEDEPGDDRAVDQRHADEAEEQHLDGVEARKNRLGFRARANMTRRKARIHEGLLSRNDSKRRPPVLIRIGRSGP
jgi:hypothetical protein